MKKIPISKMYCTCCGQRGLDIPRVKKAREAGHLKLLWCPHCNKEVNHVEIRENSKYTFEWFQKELEYNNFDEYGNRKMEFGPFRTFIYNKEEN